MKTKVHKKQLGMRIQEKRVEKNLTQEELADSVGLSSVYISSIERGVKLPSLSTAVNIANALDASLDYLLEEDLVGGYKERVIESNKRLDKLPLGDRKRVLAIMEAVTKIYEEE